MSAYIYTFVDIGTFKSPDTVNVRVGSKLMNCSIEKLTKKTPHY